MEEWKSGGRFESREPFELMERERMGAADTERKNQGFSASEHRFLHQGKRFTNEFLRYSTDTLRKRKGLEYSTVPFRLAPLWNALNR